MNGAGPAHGKEAVRVAGCLGESASCVFGGGQRGCCFGLIDTLRHSDLPESCAAASWTACWARVWLFASVAVAAPGKRTVGSEECEPAAALEGCDANGGN